MGMIYHCLRYGKPVPPLREAQLCGSPASLILALLIFASPSITLADPPPSQSTADDQGIPQEIVVTGSRLPRPNLDQPTPVSVFRTDQILDTGTPDLGDSLAQMPELGFDGTVRANENSNSPQSVGLSQPDLLNLGTSRTLTLVDGIRHVAGSSTSQAVDLNSIPPALVDHVEVITGGASAIYGSDAVSGVINIILKKRFEGFESSVQYGQPESGDFGQKFSSSFTAGKDFAGDDGNVVISGFYDRQDAIGNTDIKGFNNYALVVNPADCQPGAVRDGLCLASIPDGGKPEYLNAPNVITPLVTPYTVLQSGTAPYPTALVAFNGKGVPVPQTAQVIAYGNDYFSAVAPGSCTYTCYGLDQDSLLSPRIERAGGDLRFLYDISSNVQFTLDTKFVQTNVTDQYYPNFTAASTQLAPDNAFITPQIASALQGLTPDQYPYINRVFSDLGSRGDAITRDTYRTVATLKGTLETELAPLHWDTTVNYGRTDDNYGVNGVLFNGNLAAALDSVVNPATGQPACRVNVPSAQAPGYVAPSGLYGPASACVPYNPFGNQNTAAAVNYIIYRGAQISEHTDQATADLNLSADSSRFANLQGGPISVATGYEFRHEGTGVVNDPVIQSGITSVQPTPNFSGGFNVDELYAEITAPIFKDEPFLEQLSIDAAVRGAHYSTVGTVTANKFGVLYAPIQDIKFRATLSHSVRAPDLTEAFSPTVPENFSISDPCSVQNIQANKNRAANCVASGVPGNFVQNSALLIQGVSSGNSNLSPEKSRSYTVGLILQPSIVPNLAFTVDYYDIRINDAIEFVAPQDIANNCYDSPNLNPQYCSLLARGSDHNVNFISTTYVNAAEEFTRGLEAQISYSHSIADATRSLGPLSALTGDINFSADINYLLKLREFPFQTDLSSYHVLEGTLGYPTLKARFDVFYQQRAVGVHLTGRVIGKVALFDEDPGQTAYQESTNEPYLGTQVYFDLVVHYKPTALKGLDLYVGVNNILDQAYPVGLTDPNTTASSPAYDLVGRFLFAGAKYRL